jgi:hypothetical protein
MHLVITGPIYASGAWAWVEAAVLAAIVLAFVTLMVLVVVASIGVQREQRKLDAIYGLSKSHDTE